MELGNPQAKTLAGAFEAECGKNPHPSGTATTRTSVAGHYFPPIQGPPIRGWSFRFCLSKVLDSMVVTVFMSIVTVYVLLADDVRVLVATVHEDDGFFAMACACMFLYFLEIVLLVYAKPEYWNSFYFYLDIVATVSMISDIGWLWGAIMNQSSNPGSRINQLQIASRNSTVANRSVKIVRIMRLIRLIRLVKLYKNAQTAIKRRVQLASILPDDNAIPEESRIGKKLSELTTKRVILLILALLILLPLFDLNFFYESPTSWEFSMTQFSQFYGSSGFLPCLEEFLEWHLADMRPLIALGMNDPEGTLLWIAENSRWDSLRTAEMYYATNTKFVGIFNIRADVSLEAGLSIVQTVFVAIVMALGAIYFTKDAQTLVIFPIEKMMRKVAKIAKNPIHASEDQVINAEDGKEQAFEATCFCFKKKTEIQHFETQLLEDTLTKISTLLGLGFGEAGAKMIGQNLAKNQDLDPMGDGTMIMGVFGFCDIRNFTDTTEVLREGVMIFVNEVASIVHGTVSQCMGAANMNVGDAFLLVWKFDNSDVSLTHDLVTLNNCRRVQNLSFLALLSFLKILTKINTSTTIVKYRSYKALVDRMPRYTVRMGFGLHLGWAIEGPIGSDLKIDASYLSPHVNMASRLEAATKQYGVPLLLSGSFFRHLSPRAQNYCRQLDVVIVKGSQTPEKVYTCDLDTSSIPERREKLIDKATARLKRQELERNLDSPDFDATDLLEGSRNFHIMRKNMSSQFMDLFQESVNAYVDGDWQEAQRLLGSVLELKPMDAPAMTLLDVMKETNFHAPEGWPGYRVLTEK